MLVGVNYKPQLWHSLIYNSIWLFVVTKQSISSMKCRYINFNNTRLNGTTLLTKFVVDVSCHDKYDIKCVAFLILD